jgi:hypothetical protein
MSRTFTLSQKRLGMGFVLLLALVGTGGLAGSRIIGAHRTRTAALDLEQRAAAARAQVSVLEEERTQAEANERNLRQSLLGLSAHAPTTPAAAARKGSAQQSFDVNLMITERPELKAVFEAGAKAAEMEQYGWLMTSLTPDAAAQFASARLRHDQRLSEIARASREQGWSREDPRRIALRDEERDRHATEMSAVLGVTRVEEYLEYEKTVRPRNFVAGTLARELYYTDTPLSPTQASALTEIVVQHGRDERGRFDFDAVRWNSVENDARVLLAPAQWERLVNLSEMRQLQAQVLAIERAFGARADGK